MALKAWSTTKDSLGFAWQMREEILGGSIFYGVLFTLFLLALNSFGFSYSEAANKIAAGFSSDDTASLAINLQISLWMAQAFFLVVASFFSYKLQTNLIRRAAAPAEKPPVNMTGYALKYIAVRIFPYALMMSIGLFAFQKAWAVAAGLTALLVVVQTLMMRFELAIAATAAGHEKSSLMHGFSMGAKSGLKIFLCMVFSFVLVQIVFIPIDIVGGLFAGVLGFAEGGYGQYLAWLLEGVKTGVGIYVLAILNAAFFCALKPEYGFVVDDAFYSVGQGDDDEIVEPAE